MSLIRKTEEYLVKQHLPCSPKYRYISPDDLLSIVSNADTILDSDLVDGKHAYELSHRNHIHDDRYYTKEQVNNVYVPKNNISVPHIANNRIKARQIQFSHFTISSAANTVKIVSPNHSLSLHLGDYITWTSSNHGTNSGLNADTVDGFHFADIETFILRAIKRTSHVVTKPKIQGPAIAKYDSYITLTATDSVSAFTTEHANITYEWLLPDGNRTIGRIITYKLPDESHINERLPFKCRARDSLGNCSQYSKFIVQVGHAAPPTITNVSFSSPPPHKSNHNYDLVITAQSDTNIRYAVVCSDPNVTIVQHSLQPNKFKIIYPTYSKTTQVSFIISAIANRMISQYTLSVIVQAATAPTISNIAWSPAPPFFQGHSYTMVVNATNSTQDSLEYNVTCSNNDVILHQHDIWPNKFIVTFPEFNEDTVTVLFNIEVSNNYASSYTQELCTVTKRTHIRINRIIWSSPPPHFASKHYSVKIDATSPTNQILYNVECDSDAVVITQDRANTNVFHIQYKGISAQTDVLFTFTAYDANNSTNYSTYVTVKP